MIKKKRFIEKEISWLAFNERVLQEAADTNVPIIERVRFLGIFSNNFDEFFRVTFSDVKRRLLLLKDTDDQNKEKELLIRIQQKAMSLQNEFDVVYAEILRTMTRHNIFLINEEQVLPQESEWLKAYFRDSVLSYLIPVFVTKDINLSAFLKDELTYLAIEIKQKSTTRYAVLEIPADDLPRFIKMPKLKDDERTTIIMLDNIIRYCMKDLFQGLFDNAEYTAYTFKITRDAEFSVSDDINDTLLERMSHGLKQRGTALPVRFVYDRNMPRKMLGYFVRKFNFSSYDSIMPGGRYHNFKDFMGFPVFEPDSLVNNKLPALSCHDFDQHSLAFDAIKAKDILLYYPYYKFRYFTEFVRQAAYDPTVKKIQLTLYRVGSHSTLLNSLIDANNNQKEVSVTFELRARFDEAANINWAKKLTAAGVKVDFGPKTLKVHSKLCLIDRLEKGQLVRYAHISTGNFHEKTAQIYTDFSLFTCHPGITSEVEETFQSIRDKQIKCNYEHLIVSPKDSRSRIAVNINREILHAKQGRHAEIVFKVNSLTDEKIIKQLYKASNAGVKVRIIVRGMCCLVPGVEGFSDNISAISIIDRYLEHPRVMLFHDDGNKKLFISSADLMARNLDERVEVGCPIYDSGLKQRIIDILELQWQDNTKARIIDGQLSNAYVRSDEQNKIQSQLAIYDYLKGIESQS